MTLISFISIPFDTPTGIKKIKYDFVNNKIMTQDEVLIDMDEVVGDLHHFEKDDEVEAVAINLEEEMLKMLTQQLIDCTTEEEVIESTCAMKSKKDTTVSCDCCK